MEYAIVTLAIIVFPIVVGWWCGKNDVDPNTDYGRKYYE
jgi:hypothetical protein